MTKRREKGAKQLLTAKKSAAADMSTTAPEQNDAAVPSAEAARRSIAEAAYYRAEKRGFEPGYDVDDWLAAEAEITGCYLQRSAPAAELH